MAKIALEKMMSGDKYEGEAIRWIDKGNHYELIFTDDFITPSSTGASRLSGFPTPFSRGNSLLTDIITDMREGDKSKEIHVFVGSFGGEVAALNMILQQLLCYEHRVGINLGMACSCGWILLFACHERYVSPYSQAMYHDISNVCAGKHSELQRNAEFLSKWQQELLRLTDTEKILTPKELELSHTTEVWFTGKELIERGAAKSYDEYLDREIPMPISNVVLLWGELYAKSPMGWIRMRESGDQPLSYSELVRRMNTPPPKEHLKEMLDKVESMRNKLESNNAEISKKGASAKKDVK